VLRPRGHKKEADVVYTIVYTGNRSSQRCRETPGKECKEEKCAKLQSINLDALQSAVELFVLLEEEERGNGVGAQTNKAGNPATESPGQAFLATDIAQQAHNALAMAISVGGRHHASLDHVDGTADGSSHETSHERGRKVRAEVIAHAGLLHAKFLEGIVRGQLRGSHENCAGGIGPHATEERAESFGPGHLNQAVEGVAVVSALRRREGCIGLHAHIEHVGRVADNATNEAGGTGHGEEGEDAGRGRGVRGGRSEAGF